MPDPNQLTDHQEMLQRTQEFITEERLEEAYQQRAKRYNAEEQDIARESVSRSRHQNELVGFALKNAASLNLDVSQKARLASIRGRNLSNIIMNTPAYRPENTKLERIKETTAQVEEVLDLKLEAFITDDVEEDKRKRHIAYSSEKIRVAYQKAIMACREYMTDRKNIKSPRAAEEYNLVVEQLSQLVDEYNRLCMAQQRLFREQIGGDDFLDITVRDLLIEERKYAAAHPVVTPEEVEAFKAADPRVRSMHDTGLVQRRDFEDRRAARFFYNAIFQKGLPNAMAEALGKKPEDKAKAVSYLKEIYGILSGFKENKVMAWTFVIDDMLLTLFQQEDGTIQLCYDTWEGSSITPVRKQLPANARTLLATMSANMVENEELFGKQWVADNIMSRVEDSSVHTDVERQAVDNDLASAYLRKQLGVKNIQLTNIPSDERIHLAKRLMSGEDTPERALDFIDNYEYGGREKREEKRAAKENRLSAMEKELKIFDEIAQGGGFKSMQEMVDRRRNGAPLPAEAIAYEETLKKQTQERIRERNQQIQYYNDSVFQPAMKRAGDEKKAKEERFTQCITELQDVTMQILQQANEVEEDALAPNELDTRKEELQSEMARLSEEMAGCDDMVAALLRNRSTAIADISEEYNAKLDLLDREMGLLRDWKEYYALHTAVGMPVILNFSEWKTRMKEDTENWERANEDARKLKDYYDNIITEYLKLENDYKSEKYSPLSSLTMDNINGQDTLELLRHRKNMEEAGKLADMVVFLDDAEQVSEESRKKKAAGILEGTEWTKEEEEVKELIADFICSEKTWEMDINPDPGARLFGILEQHRGLAIYMAGDPKRLEKFLNGVVKKLPLQVMGLQEKDIIEPVLKMAEAIRAEAMKEIKKQRKEIEERDVLREQKREAKRWELAIKRKDGATKEEIDEEYRRLKSGKYKKTSFFQKLTGFFGFANDKTEEELKAEEDFKKALSEIEKAGEDEHSTKDNLVRIYDDYGLMSIGVSRLFTDKNDKEKRNMVASRLVEAEKAMTGLMKKQISQVESVMGKFVEANFGGESLVKPVKPVPYYREKNISLEERERREKLGSEQLEIMISNAMMSKAGQGQYVRNVFTEYIPRSSMIDMRCMLSSAIRNAKPVKLPAKAKVKDEERIKALNSYVGGLFKGAGPLMQKLLQGFSPDMIPPGMESAFEDVKSNLAPIPREIIEAQILSIIERSGGTIKKIMIQKSLGAASVGQAFLCTVYGPDGFGRDVVIKILRPDVRNRMLREEKIMRRCARNAGAGMLKTFDGQMERYKEELDLTIEARNCELGKIYDSSTSGVMAMRISRIAPPAPNVLMAERADGDTVVDILKRSKELREEEAGSYFEYKQDGSRVLDKDGRPKMILKKGADLQAELARWNGRLDTLQKQKKMLDRMSASWVREGIFGKGFYHGDLHAGNIMMSSNRLTLIDFGNATRLSQFQQDKVLLMTLSAAAGDADGFMDGFKALLGEDSRRLLDEKKDRLMEIFKEVMSLGTFTSSAERIGAALLRAQELGFELPSAIYSFQQCQMRLQNTVDDFKKEIEEVQHIIKGLDEAYNGSSLQIKQNYFRLSAESDENADITMKLQMLPADREELLKMIRTETPEEEKQVMLYFQDMFTLVNHYQTLPEAALEEALYTPQEGLTFSFLNNFISREKWLELIDDDFTSYPERQRQGGEPSQEVKDRQKANIGKLREYLKSLNVTETLKQLKEARRNKAGAEEIERLENEAVDKIMLARTTHFSAKPQNIKRKLLTRCANDNERMENEYQSHYAERFNAGKYWDHFRERIRDPKYKKDIEEEIGLYAEDRRYGAEIRSAFQGVNAALSAKPQDPESVDQAIESLISALRVPVLMTLGSYQEANKMPMIKFSKVKDFVEIMGDVVGVEWRKALKSLGKLKMIDFGRKIKGDIKRREVGYTEIILDIIFNRAD